MESRSTTKTDKIECSGRIQAMQPRIRLMRSFDERSHSYLGYVLRVEGTISDETGEFIIALGKGRTSEASISSRHGGERPGGSGSRSAA